VTDKPGIFGEVALEGGVSLDIVRVDLGQSVPVSAGGYAGLVLGGGEQSVYRTDRYPYLEAEMELVRRAEKEERPLLGLCLGAQLIAQALGGRVYPAAQKEIGFYPVRLEPLCDLDPVWQGLPRTFVTTHWHGDVFEIPPGGMHLGSSDLTPNQLFRYGAVSYGLQFHLEMTPEIFAEMVAESREQLAGLGFPPDQLLAEAPGTLGALRESARTVFTRWLELL